MKFIRTVRGPETRRNGVILTGNSVRGEFYAERRAIAQLLPGLRGETAVAISNAFVKEL